MDEKKKKIAVILLNMGGPKGQSDVRLFLYRLFSDPAILTLPFGLRHLLAFWISSTRKKSAQANYAKMGGGSPIVAETEKQKKALQNLLEKKYPEIEWLCEIAMRYWAPRANIIIEKIRIFSPGKVVLLPLYPQFSGTTTGSSIEDWINKSKKDIWKTKTILSYENNAQFIQAHTQKIISTWKKAGKPANVRILFSAHGLPERTVLAGDPYPQQIETSAHLIAEQLPTTLADWKICYQSRVGRLKWLEPSTKDEIEVAGAENKNLIIVPIAFVSEHIETLVELDIEYQELAKKAGIRQYLRVQTLQDDLLFITCLAELVGEKR